MTLSLFEKATKNAIRYQTRAGEIGVEDLWTLPLTSQTGRANLDSVARETNRELKELAEESFVDTTPDPRRAQLQLKLDVVKRVIEVRIAENKAKSEAAARDTERARLRELIANKKAEALNDKTVEELEAQLTALGG